MGTSLAGTLDHSQEPRCGRWRSGLRHEHIRAVVIATDIKWERGSLVTVTLRISSFTARSWGDGVARHGSRISRMPLAPWVSSRSFSMLEAGAEVAQALDAMIGAGVEAANVLASPVLYTARDLMFGRSFGLAPLRIHPA
jgi:hypothetical protein